MAQRNQGRRLQATLLKNVFQQCPVHITGIDIDRNVADLVAAFVGIKGAMSQRDGNRIGRARDLKRHTRQMAGYRAPPDTLIAILPDIRLVKGRAMQVEIAEPAANQVDSRGLIQSATMTSNPYSGP